MLQSLLKKVAFRCNFVVTEALAQVFSCEFFEIFKNTLFTEHLQMTASETGSIREALLQILY